MVKVLPLLLIIQGLFLQVLTAKNPTSLADGIEGTQGLTWPLPSPNNLSFAVEKPTLRNYIDCDSHRWARASSFIIAQGAQRLKTIIPSTVILRPYGQGSANRVFCYRGDGVWVQNWEPTKWELDLGPIADKVNDVLKRCCGNDCTDTKALHTKSVRGTYVVVQGKKYGVGIAHLSPGQTCENTPP